jgi:hypothetical protein
VPLVDLKFLTVLPRVLQELQIGGTNTFGRFNRSYARPGAIGTSCFNVAANPRRFSRRF